MIVRRYEDAERVLARALELAPENFELALDRAILHKNWKGDLSLLRRTLKGIPTSIDPNFKVTLERVWLATAEGRHADAIGILGRCPLAAVGGCPPQPHGTALGRPTPPRRSGGTRARQFPPRPGAARAEIRERPDDARAYEFLALALAGLGAREGAFRSVHKAMELMPVSRDALEGPLILETRARIYLTFGKPERALDDLEAFLKFPSGDWTPPVWDRDPHWAPLRDHPRFVRMLKQWPAMQTKPPSLEGEGLNGAVKADSKSPRSAA